MHHASDKLVAWNIRSAKAKFDIDELGVCVPRAKSEFENANVFQVKFLQGRRDILLICMHKIASKVQPCLSGFYHDSDLTNLCHTCCPGKSHPPWCSIGLSSWIFRTQTFRQNVFVTLVAGIYKSSRDACHQGQPSCWCFAEVCTGLFATSV